jgi:hypothetical protein
LTTPTRLLIERETPSLCLFGSFSVFTEQLLGEATDTATKR